MKLLKNLRKKSNPNLQNCRVVIIGCKCDLCGRVFKCLTDLKSHNKVHHFTNTQSDSDLPRIVTNFTNPDEKTSKFVRLILKMGDEILAVKSVDRDCIKVIKSGPELRPCQVDENEFTNGEDDGSDLELTRIQLEEKYRELRVLNTASELKLKTSTINEKVELPINSQVDSSNSVPDLDSDDEIVICYDSRQEKNLDADDCEIIYQSRVLSNGKVVNLTPPDETVVEKVENYSSIEGTTTEANLVTKTSEEQVSSSSCLVMELDASLEDQKNETESVSLNGSELSKLESHDGSGRESNPFVEDRKVRLNHYKNRCDIPLNGATRTPSPCNLEDLPENLLQKKKRRVDEAMELVEAKTLRKNCLTIKCGTTGIRIEKSIIPMNLVDQENSTSEHINSKNFLFIEKRKSSIRPVSIASSLLSSVNR